MGLLLKAKRKPLHTVVILVLLWVLGSMIVLRLYRSNKHTLFPSSTRSSSWSSRIVASKDDALPPHGPASYSNYPREPGSPLSILPIFNLNVNQPHQDKDEAHYVDITYFESAKFQGTPASLIHSIPSTVMNRIRTLDVVDDAQIELSYILFRGAPFYTKNIPVAYQEQWDRIRKSGLMRDSIESLISKTVFYVADKVEDYSEVDAEDFDEVGRRLRAFILLASILKRWDEPMDRYALSSAPILQHKSSVEALFAMYRQLVFPWHKDMQYSGRGLVYLVGNNQFELAFHSILMTRKVVGTALDVEVWYGGEEDLDADKIQVFQSLAGVQVRNLFSVFDKEQVNVRGWAMKPFAMLASSFEEVIFVDADVLFMQDPANMLSFQGYKRSGTVFFHDRQMNIGKDNTHRWFETFMHDLSPDAAQAEYVRYNTIHEQDSGVVVLNKGTSVLFGLMAVCFMNRPPYQDVAYKNVHGDKETFWMGFELMKLPYYFPRGYGGTIGWMNPDRDHSVCGNLYHPDESWKPLWWNGGVMMNKHTTDTFFDSLEFWSTNKFAQQGEWDWETSERPFCNKPKYPQSEIGQLSQEEKEMGSRMIEAGKQVQRLVKEEQWNELIDYYQHFI